MQNARPDYGPARRTAAGPSHGRARNTDPDYSGARQQVPAPGAPLTHSDATAHSTFLAGE